MYKISTESRHGLLPADDVEGTATVNSTSSEVDTQLFLYDRDATSILLFQDNIGDEPSDIATVDLLEGWPVRTPDSEIVWEAEFTGTYYIKVRTTTCDEDLDEHCNDVDVPPEDPRYNTSPDGVGLNTEYTISLEEIKDEIAP